MATVTEPMTTETMLALPGTNAERWLIEGELRERPMTIRDRFHSQVLMRVGFVLLQWLDKQAEPRGRVLGGEAGIRLQKNPDTTVGMDAVYISADLAAEQSGESTIIEGVPTLAVEILSPVDTVEEIEEKLQIYLKAGVSLVWIINPYQRTVLVHQPGRKPALFNVDDELSAEPHLPGFRIAVSDLFR